MTRFRGKLMLSASLLIGGVVVGTLFPTKRTDPVGRKIIFWFLVLVLSAAVFFVSDGLYALVSGDGLW